MPATSPSSRRTSRLLAHLTLLVAFPLSVGGCGAESDSPATGTQDGTTDSASVDGAALDQAAAPDQKANSGEPEDVAKDGAGMPDQAAGDGPQAAADEADAAADGAAATDVPPTEVGGAFEPEVIVSPVRLQSPITEGDCTIWTRVPLSTTGSRSGRLFALDGDVYYTGQGAPAVQRYHGGDWYLDLFDKRDYPGGVTLGFAATADLAVAITGTVFVRRGPPGAAWREVGGQPSLGFDGVAMAIDGLDVFASTSQGQIFKLSGADWQMVGETAGPVWALWSGGGRLYVGYSGGLRVHDDKGWSDVPLPAGGSVYALAGHDLDHLFAIDSNSRLYRVGSDALEPIADLRFCGGPMTVAGNKIVLGCFATVSADTHAVEHVTPPPRCSPDLGDGILTADVNGDLYATDACGEPFRWSGGGWQSMVTTPPAGPSVGLTVSGAGDIYGWSTREVFKLDGNEWHSLPNFPGADRIADVSASPGSSLLVWLPEQFLQFKDGAWTQGSVPDMATSSGVAISDVSAMAAGSRRLQEGVMSTWNGTTWTSPGYPCDRPLSLLARVGSKVVAQMGPESFPRTGCVWDGTAWSPLTLPGRWWQAGAPAAPFIYVYNPDISAGTWSRMTAAGVVPISLDVDALILGGPDPMHLVAALRDGNIAEKDEGSPSWRTHRNSFGGQAERLWASRDQAIAIVSFPARVLPLEGGGPRSVLRCNFNP